MRKIKVLELFGGIGACSKALERLGIDYEIADYVEIDKYAVASFNAIHNTNFEPQDICEWDKAIEVDLIMHGSPCQDFSLAGKQAGGDEGSGTRSSLMYETIRIVGKLRPKYVIWENVKNLLSKKHIHNFNAYLETMEQLGYTNYYQVLNAKDYGIPQNRERVFTVSIRKDIDAGFVFPKKQELKLKLKDMLEDFVSDNYFLTNEQIKRIETTTYNVGKTRIQKKDWCDTLCARDWKDPKCVEIDEKYYLSNKMKNYISKQGTANFKNPDCKINLDVARPLTTDPNKRAGTTNYLSEDLPKNYDLSILIKEATKQGYKEAFEGDGVNISSRMKYQRGNVQKESIQTITTSGGNDRGVVVNDKPRKDIKELDKNCEYCGKQLERKRFNGRLEDFTVFSNRKYCNRECMRKDWVKIGDNHNQSYSNAHTTARKINELILHKEVCELCGSDTNLDIHHIDGNWQNNT